MSPNAQQDFPNTPCTLPILVVCNNYLRRVLINRNQESAADAL